MERRRLVSRVQSSVPTASPATVCYAPYMERTQSGVELRRIPVSPNDDYRAGADGQIYSRTRYAGFGRKERVDWYAMKGTVGSKKYPMVSLCHENVKVTKTVHRLVCMAFQA